jgi:hypothetical protein
LQYKILGAPKKFKKWPCPLFRPKTNHTCHQKQNPSRKTVPLNVAFNYVNFFFKKWKRRKRRNIEELEK